MTGFGAAASAMACRKKVAVYKTSQKILLKFMPHYQQG